MKHFLIAIAALAVVALAEGLYHTVGFFAERRREELRRRLQSLGTGEAPGRSLLRRGRLATSHLVDELLRGVPLLERVELLLEQAEVELTVAQLLGAAVALAIGGAIGGFLLAGTGMAVLALVAGAVTPFLIVLSLRERRARKLSQQLPDALDMMARSLRAGHALPSAFKLVAGEMPSPASVEFGRAFEEQNLGMSFEKAVVQMTERVPTNPDLKIFAVSVIVQKETGGNLVEILEKIAETIRARERFHGKLRSLTAEGKVSGVVLGALPILTGLVIAALNPTYFDGVLDVPLGRNILIYAVVSWFVGLIWLRQMGKVEL
jgi:tight adherence protein B